MLPGYYKYAGRILSNYEGELMNLSRSIEENVLMDLENEKDQLPYNTMQFGRMDEVKAARELVLCCWLPEGYDLNR